MAKGRRETGWETDMVSREGNGQAMGSGHSHPGSSWGREEE